MTAFEWLLLFALSVLWGGSYFFNEIGLTGLPPLWIIALRLIVGALVLWVLVFARKLPVPRSLGVWLAFISMAAINNVIPFFLITWGQTATSAGFASIMNAATPIFAVFIAGAFLADEPLTKRKLAGATLGLAGVAILMGPGAFAGADTNLLARLALLGAALAYAISGVYGRRFREMGVQPLVAAAIQLTMATLLAVPLVLSVEGPASLANANTNAWLAVIGLGMFSTALAYILYFRLLASAGATNLMLVTLLIPVTAILLGVLILSETLVINQLLGMAVIAFGLSVIDGRLWKRFRNTKEHPHG
ncbi:MAG: DMT family transporter [Pseudomonadota bacterium]